MNQADAPALPTLPPRDPRGHKGTFGTVAVVGGQTGATPMIGGPALAAVAALRTGAGLVRIVAPEPTLSAALIVAPSATGVSLPVDETGALIAHEAVAAFDRVLTAATVVAIGPGLGVSAGAVALSLRAVGQTQTPVVADADALNALAQTPDFARDIRAQAVLTPHPGEFARLAKPLGVTADPTLERERPIAAEQLAQRLGCVVVLKGAGTVVSDGQRTWVNETIDAALATGGTGDVLTGVISGLIAQHYRKPTSAGSRSLTSEALGGLSLFDCARLGVRAHALAAAIWRQRAGAEAGLLAMELAGCLPAACEALRTRA